MAPPESTDPSGGGDALGRSMLAFREEILGRLSLSAAEAARVSGITPRQLIYWTRKGFIRTTGPAERDYDVAALERAIHIRRALEAGHSLEVAARLVEREIALRDAELARLAVLDGDDLEVELRRRLQRLEERVATLRHTLPVSLTLTRLRHALAALARLESAGALEPANLSGETARTIALPTTMPSASAPTVRACAGVEMPNPTQMGRMHTPRNAAIVCGSSGGSSSCMPVTPSREIR